MKINVSGIKKMRSFKPIKQAPYKLLILESKKHSLYEMVFHSAIADPSLWTGIYF